MDISDSPASDDLAEHTLSQEHAEHLLSQEEHVEHALYSVERAKSSRSCCRKKTCGRLIDKSSIRIGKQLETNIYKYS